MYNTQFFIMGLREGILARLRTNKFETLEAASKAAKEAEDYLKSVASLRTHHVRVHAVNQRSSGFGKDRGRSSSRESKKVQNATRVVKKVIGAENAPNKQTVLTELDHRVVVTVHPELDSKTNQQQSIT